MGRVGCDGMVERGLDVGWLRQPGAIEGECALHFGLANERTPPG